MGRISHAEFERYLVLTFGKFEVHLFSTSQPRAVAKSSGGQAFEFVRGVFILQHIPQHAVTQRVVGLATGATEQ